MNAEDLKRIIKEELVAILAENAPAKEKETTTAPPKTMYEVYLFDLMLFFTC